jgi:hypothetical protein
MELDVIHTTSLDYVSKNCSSRDRILLINAPVVESRYQWVRWNQPLDLLKLSTFLKSEIGCDVKLYDTLLTSGATVAAMVISQSGWTKRHLTGTRHKYGLPR